MRAFPEAARCEIGAPGKVENQSTKIYDGASVCMTTLYYSCCRLDRQNILIINGAGNIELWRSPSPAPPNNRDRLVAQPRKRDKSSHSRFSSPIITVASGFFDIIRESTSNGKELNEPKSYTKNSRARARGL